MTVKTWAKVKAERDARERASIHNALRQNGWRLLATAAALDLWPSDLRRRIHRLGLEPEYLERNPGKGRFGPRKLPESEGKQEAHKKST